MKTPRLWPTLAFTLYLLIGLLLGANLRAALAQVLPSRQAPPAGPSEQRSILIVFVDDLTVSRPRLQGSWLMVYASIAHPLSLFPIYPSLSDTPSTRHEVLDHQLEQTFGLTGSHRLSQDFLQLLKDKRRLKLDGYIILDKYSLARLLDAWEKVNSHPGAQATLPALPRPWEQPAEALNHQKAVLSYLCKRATNARLDLNSLYKETREHIATDLPPKQFITEWQYLLDNSVDRTCEFPTFQK